MSTHAKVSLTTGLTAQIHIRQFVLTADEPIADGGLDLGPKPTELMLAALGSCAAITARLYAQRKGWDLRAVEIDLTTERFKKQDYPAYDGDSAFVREFTQRITEPQMFIETWVDAVIAEEKP